MIGRAARVAAAAAALALAASEVRTWRAEQAYQRGVRATDPRSGDEVVDDVLRDVPGRLEAYEAAARIDPGEPLYALRAGQMHVLRAGRRPPPPDRGERVAAARELLERSLRALPLDSRAHDALAQAAVLDGDADGALRDSRRAVLLGRRRSSALEQASRRCAWAWRRTGDPDALRDAAEVARLGFEILDGADPSVAPPRAAPGVRPLQSLLAAEDGPGVDDLLLAVRGRPELAAAAARALDAVDADAARQLRERAGAGPGPR